MNRKLYQLVSRLIHIEIQYLFLARRGHANMSEPRTVQAEPTVAVSCVRAQDRLRQSNVAIPVILF